RAAEEPRTSSLRPHNAPPEGRAQAQSDDAAELSRSILDVEGLGAGRLAVLVERDLLDAGLGLAQQPVAMDLEGLAALVDEDRILELHVALFQALDDTLELFQSLLEAHRLDVGMVVRVGHGLP